MLLDPAAPLLEVELVSCSALGLATTSSTSARALAMLLDSAALALPLELDFKVAMPKNPPKTTPQCQNYPPPSGIALPIYFLTFFTSLIVFSPKG